MHSCRGGEERQVSVGGQVWYKAKNAKRVSIFQAQIQYLLGKVWEARLKRRWEKEGASLYRNISMKM